MNKYEKDFRIQKMSFILMADTVDRLDMILLELRHLQMNIIYSMHEPAFNAPLRFEEDFLWGGEEKSSLGDDTRWSLDEEKDNNAVKENIILFPYHGNENDEKKNNSDKEGKRKKERNKVYSKLQKRIDQLWKEEWRMRHQRSYDHLCGTQLLKRAIVKDKIDFCRFAIKEAGLIPGLHKKSTIKCAELAQFIVLRNAIHQRSIQYLDRIKEYQSLFNKVLDIGVKDFPVPSLERRREIGIHVDFLNKRVHSIHAEIEHLAKHLQIDVSSNDKIILHSWKHHFTAEHQFQKKYPDDNTPENQNLHHITSNYYMPERADLQPMLAHEVAHLIVHQYFDNLSDKFLRNSESEFVDLLRSFFRVLQQFDNLTGLGTLSPAHRPRALLKEICCDLLAASVKGFAYLYALLLETVGADLYKLLASSDREFTNNHPNAIDLDLIKYLSGSGGRPETMRRDWWLRLKVLICWLKKTHHWRPSGLDDILLEGSDRLLDNLLIFLDEITPTPEDRKGPLWCSLAERLHEEIEDSGAVVEVKKWRKKRSEKGDCSSSARINEEVQMLMKKIHIGMKLEKGKWLCYRQEIQRKFNKKNIDEVFDMVYLIDKPCRQGHEWVGREPDHKDAYYIRHLYDIPWKCALTRSIDLFGNFTDDIDMEEKENGLASCDRWIDYYKDDPHNKMLRALHYDNAAGRELHSIALEFYMFESEKSFDRLIHVTYLMNNMSEKDKKTEIIYNYKLKNLLNNANKATSKGNKDKKIAFDCLSNFLFELKRQKSQGVISLFNYIAAYIYKNDVIECISKQMTNTHKEGCRKNIENDAARCFKMLLISKHSAGGFYAMKKADQGKPIFTSKEYTPVSLLKGNPYWFWIPPNDTSENDKCVYPFDCFKYSNTSGRYDAISFVRVRQMHRCLLPHFETKNPKNDEKAKIDALSFPSLLTRREFGIKIDFRYQKDCTPHIDKNNVDKRLLAGYIYVTLKRRSLRIPFLARLLAAVNKDESKLKPEKWLAEYLKEQDTALLLDGSADILLALRMDDTNISEKDKKEHKLQRTGHVIDLAYWLYQDFMVDRTELILSAAVLDDVAENISKNEKSEFSLDCEIRCFEDRFLDGGIDRFRKRMQDGLNVSKEETKKENLKLLVTIEVTAGRKDFLLRFFNPSSRIPRAEDWYFDKNEGFREALVKLLEDGPDGDLFVDRIEVNVNKHPSEKRGGNSGEE